MRRCNATERNLLKLCCCWPGIDVFAIKAESARGQSSEDSQSTMRFLVTVSFFTLAIASLSFVNAVRKPTWGLRCAPYCSSGRPLAGARGPCINSCFAITCSGKPDIQTYSPVRLSCLFQHDGFLRVLLDPSQSEQTSFWVRGTKDVSLHQHQTSL